MLPIRPSSTLERAAFALSCACLAVSLAGCGVTTGRGSSSAGTNPLPPATTTLQAETGNNTSAADSFTRQSNGNVGAGNVSKLPLASLLPGGSGSKVYVTWMGWFGRPDHMSVGYSSADAGQVHRQVQDMISRGVSGAIAAWYGPGTTSIETATELLKSEAESHAGQFDFAIMEDVGALGTAAMADQCEVTDQLISDLSYAAAHYENSPAYLRMNGRPVVFFFGVDAFYIDWKRVVASIPGNPLLIFEGPDGLTRSLSDGGFSWIEIDTNDPFNSELAAQDAFYSTAQQQPGRMAFGSAYKGFNDTLAPWGTNRVIDQHCGQTWLQTFNEVGKYYSAGKPLPAMQIATWNDYEEGTAIETGIENCIYLVPSQSGTSIQWTVNGGEENTIDHYTVFISKDGTNLSRLADLPRGTHSFNLSQLSLASDTYVVYIKAIGVPGMQNKMSAGIAYHPGDQPPIAQLTVAQTGPLTYKASTSGSSGNIARAQIDFGDGTVVSGASPSHTYNAVGKYLVTASVYDAAGASTVAVQQISAKASPAVVSIASPGDGSTVSWPTMLVASSTAGTPVHAMRVLIDGQPAYAASGDTLDTSLKVFTGRHQITVQSLDDAGNATASASVDVLAEPDDIPPVANISIKPLSNLAPTAVLGCTATSVDPDGFLISQQLQYSDGSLFTTPAAPHTFASPGTYKATASITDQFGATSTTSTTFSAGSGSTPAEKTPATSARPAPRQSKPLQPMRPPW